MSADNHNGDFGLLGLALGLIAAFMAGEIVAAVLSGSLALISDAGHMAADAGAVAGSMWAIKLANRPASHAWSFGLPRAEILAAALNGITLLVVAVVILMNAIHRLAHPPKVVGATVIAVSLAGIVVNVAISLVLARANKDSLNIKGVVQHIVTDLAAFVGTCIAGVAIIVFGFRRADPVASIFVVAIMLRAAWLLLHESGRILLEGTPEEVDLPEVRRHICEVAGVISVHDLHAWTLTSKLPVLSAHVVVEDTSFVDGSAGRILDSLQECLSGHFDVEHSTFQLEPAGHVEHEIPTHD